MKTVAVTNVSRSRTLGNRIGVADRHLTRLRGLLGRPKLEPGEGLLIRPVEIFDHDAERLRPRELLKPAPERLAAERLEPRRGVVGERALLLGEEREAEEF